MRHSVIIQWIRKEDMLESFGKYPKPLNGVGCDGGLEDVEGFICWLYESEVVDSGTV